MIKVTREQMEAVEWAKIASSNLASIIKRSERKLFTNILKSLNGLDAEKIVLAWHGHVEVESDYVSFDEAYKARREGKRVLLHANNREVLFLTDIKLEGCYLGILTLDELVNGKFTIGVDDNA